MASDTERVVMVALGMIAHCCLIFLPTIGEFRPTIGSTAFAFAALVVASEYDICPPSWRIQNPNCTLLIEFLVRVGILNFALTTIWLPLVMFLSASTSVIGILTWPLDALGLGGAATSWAQKPEAPRQLAALFALIAAACAVYATDFCCTVKNVVTRYID